MCLPLTEPSYTGGGPSLRDLFERFYVPKPRHTSSKSPPSGPAEPSSRPSDRAFTPLKPSIFPWLPLEYPPYTNEERGVVAPEGRPETIDDILGLHEWLVAALLTTKPSATPTECQLCGQYMHDMAYHLEGSATHGNKWRVAIVNNLAMEQKQFAVAVHYVAARAAAESDQLSFPERGQLISFVMRWGWLRECPVGKHVRFADEGSLGPLSAFHERLRRWAFAYGPPLTSPTTDKPVV